MKITSLDVKDVRFPTAQKGHGTDAMVSFISFLFLIDIVCLKSFHFAAY